MDKKDAVRKGDKIAIRYVGMLESGQYFDIAYENKPFVYIVGKDQVLPAFDREVVGMKVGETKKFRLLASEAYGPLQGDLLVEVPLEHLPPNIVPRVGMYIQVPLKSIKKSYPFKITRVGDVSVSINANHPLAGRDLIYEVTVVAVKHPKKKNIS